MLLLIEMTFVRIKFQALNSLILLIIFLNFVAGQCGGSKFPLIRIGYDAMINNVRGLNSLNLSK